MRGWLGCWGKDAGLKTESTARLRAKYTTHLAEDANCARLWNLGHGCLRCSVKLSTAKLPQMDSRAQRDSTDA
jgi:hypothetical protein